MKFASFGRQSTGHIKTMTQLSVDTDMMRAQKRLSARPPPTTMPGIQVRLSSEVIDQEVIGYKRLGSLRRESIWSNKEKLKHEGERGSLAPDDKTLRRFSTRRRSKQHKGKKHKDKSERSRTSSIHTKDLPIALAQVLPTVPPADVTITKVKTKKSKKDLTVVPDAPLQISKEQMGNRFVATTIIHGQQRVVKFKQNLSYLSGMGSQLTISAKGPASKEQRNLEFISVASKKSMSKETAIQSKAHSRVDVSIMRSADNLEADRLSPDTDEIDLLSQIGDKETIDTLLSLPRAKSRRKYKDKISANMGLEDSEIEEMKKNYQPPKALNTMAEFQKKFIKDIAPITKQEREDRKHSIEFKKPRKFKFSIDLHDKKETELINKEPSAEALPRYRKRSGYKPTAEQTTEMSTEKEEEIHLSGSSSRLEEEVLLSAKSSQKIMKAKSTPSLGLDVKPKSRNVSIEKVISKEEMDIPLYEEIKVTLDEEAEDNNDAEGETSPALPSQGVSQTDLTDKQVDYLKVGETKDKRITKRDLGKKNKRKKSRPKMKSKFALKSPLKESHVLSKTDQSFLIPSHEKSALTELLAKALEKRLIKNSVSMDRFEKEAIIRSYEKSFLWQCRGLEEKEKASLLHFLEDQISSSGPDLRSPLKNITAVESSFVTRDASTENVVEPRPYGSGLVRQSDALGEEEKAFLLSSLENLISSSGSDVRSTLTEESSLLTSDVSSERDVEPRSHKKSDGFTEKVKASLLRSLENLASGSSPDRRKQPTAEESQFFTIDASSEKDKEQDFLLRSLKNRVSTSGPDVRSPLKHPTPEESQPLTRVASTEKAFQQRHYRPITEDELLQNMTRGKLLESLESELRVERSTLSPIQYSLPPIVSQTGMVLERQLDLENEHMDVADHSFMEKHKLDTARNAAFHGLNPELIRRKLENDPRKAYWERRLKRLPKPVTRRKTKIKPKFTGWDCDKPLADHLWRRLPREQDNALHLLRFLERRSDSKHAFPDTQNEERVKTPSTESRDYILQFGLHELFEFLMVCLITDKPDKPLDFLIDLAHCINAEQKHRREADYVTRRGMQNSVDSDAHRMVLPYIPSEPSSLSSSSPSSTPAPETTSSSTLHPSPANAASSPSSSSSSPLSQSSSSSSSHEPESSTPESPSL
ncbi:uncharacterized protein LOC106068584 isoform X4 [Biomphalaria glabrata]|uniref:Uncharacterized protein LOC106068584 isoform X4 n=1 Tax=Biomphalaria glabrata TaxID=6526 RepID=A0A9W2Z6N4_BIOGL|nr:uncharacterized protein LOC106068584 isoform X4 [Biomphalaria glabrata]